MTRSALDAVATGEVVVTASGRRVLPGEPWFPAGESMLHEVLGNRLVGLFYGPRALVVGSLEPLATVATVLNSRATRDGRYYERLASTATMFEDVVLGDRATADRALRRVAAMHRKVRGTLDRDAGPDHPAGTPYAYDDPWLSFFTMAVLCDAAHALFTTYVRDLSPAEERDLYADWRLFGELFGMPADAAPATWPEFRETFDGWLWSDRPHLHPLARVAGIGAFHFPWPRPLQGLNDLTYLLLWGTLPKPVRAIYDVPWTRAHDAAHAVQRRLIRSGGGLLPGPLREGRVIDPFGQRLLGALEPRQTRIVRGHLDRLGWT